MDGTTCKKCSDRCATCYDVDTIAGYVGSAAYGGNDTCSRCNWGYFLDVAINSTITSYTDTGHICRDNCTENPTGYYNVLAMNHSLYQGVDKST